MLLLKVFVSLAKSYICWNKYWPLSDMQKMQNAIRTMINEIVVNAPRDDRNGWNIQNFMKCCIFWDIGNYGSPNNVDAAPNENNLIYFAKKPGERAHKKEVFES